MAEDALFLQIVSGVLEEISVNEKKIILHLCAKEGSDTKPYRDAGYDVRIIGEEIGVENYTPPPNVYGIMANPPCTMFSIARSNPKEPRDLNEGMRLVKECLRIIWKCQSSFVGNSNGTSPLKWWAMENPATGFLRWFMGKPTFEYNQIEYGSPFSKRTALWGFFETPKRPILFNPVPSGRSLMHKRDGELSRGQVRARCPIDFAKAFYEANP